MAGKVRDTKRRRARAPSHHAEPADWLSERPMLGGRMAFGSLQR
ncbi:MAG: hypothetical protein Q7R34_04635 [Dehalococcoidia bacterium]|nr:hypothetical protein [Dehalococcoidia bacterium]